VKQNYDLWSFRITLGQAKTRQPRCDRPRSLVSDKHPTCFETSSYVVTLASYTIRAIAVMRRCRWDASKSLELRPCPATTSIVIEAQILSLSPVNFRQSLAAIEKTATGCSLQTWRLGSGDRSWFVRFVRVVIREQLCMSSQNI
jgi:hypothetical protein